jgi:hypothetical protein
MTTQSQPASQPQLYNESALRALGVTPYAGCVSQSSGRVVIGFVDYGFDLLHPCLLDPTGTKSRFKFLWDQNRAPKLVRQANFPISAVYDYSADDLNQLIAAASLQRRSGLDAAYDPHSNYYGKSGVIDGAHGTMMASIAAGTAYDGFRSPAPFADLIGVQLAVADTDWREETASGEPTWRDWSPASGHQWQGWRTYDACPQIVHAIHYIYDRASAMHAELVIINLSIGTWAGAHDGNSPVEQAITKVIGYGQRPGATACQVVIGTGNAGADQGHFTATLAAGAMTEFQWLMNTVDCTQNKLEIWYDGAPLTIRMSGPPGSIPLQISPDATHPIMFGGTRVGLAEHTPAARGSLSRVRILLHPPYCVRSDKTSADRLAWTLTLANPAARAAANPTKVHAWVERDAGSTERSWLVPHHLCSTLCCLATATGATVVGGAAHHAAGGAMQPLPFSGQGPAPWAGKTAAAEAFGTSGRPLMAPASGIWGAQSKTSGFTRTSGTSAAAALMSGALAALHIQRADAVACRQPGTPALAATEA